MKKKQSKNASCPVCGTEPAITGRKATIAEAHAASAYQTKLPRTAKERIEALRAMGMNVSHLFAMQGANGGECIASNKDGYLTVLNDDDPLFKLITDQGDVPNRRLFRRWVTAQMFHMMTCTDYRSGKPIGVTGMIHRLGYEYQWRMLLDELHAQMKMEERDPENFADRNRWFNADVVYAMAEDYVHRLKERIDSMKVKKCKGVPYKRVGSRNIFVEDMETKIYQPLQAALYGIRRAKNTVQLYNAAKKFNGTRIKMPYDAPQCKVWVNAYKGAGAFYTAQNLIRFHGCTVVNDKGRRLDKYQSLASLSTKAEEYKDGKGWRLLAFLKKMLADNNIDIKKKMAEWHKKK